MANTSGILQDPQIEDLLPHRGRLLLIEKIRHLSDNEAETQATVNAQWPFFSNGRAAAIVLIELVAQTAGVNNGWTRLRQDGIHADRKGWIVGIKQASLLVASVAANGILITRTVNRYAFEGFREIEGTVAMGSQTVAEVTLHLMRSEPTEPIDPPIEKESKQ